MAAEQTINPISAAVRGLKPSATLAINERSAALQAQGKEVFKLGLGQSPFPVPRPVVRALELHAAEKDYLPVQGLVPLREAVAGWHQRRGDLDASACEVMVGPGSKELLFLLQLVHQSTLTIPGPSWVSYAPQAGILNKQVEWIPTRREDDWRLTAAALDRHCHAEPARPRLLILNYPNNPTGLSYSQEELQALAEVARRYRVVVLSDEIYGELHHDGKHRSMASFYPEGTIISSGLSKWCGAGGWRLGYFVFPHALRPLLEACCAVASETFTSVSAPIQWAAVRAFEPCSEIDVYLRDSRRILKGLGTYIARRLRQAGAYCPTPEGGFYAMPDFSSHAGRLAARGVRSSADMAERILQDTGVACLPGSCFGRPQAEFSLRLSYVDFDGAKALESMRQVGENVLADEAFLRRCCARTIDAIDRLAVWFAAQR